MSEVLGASPSTLPATMNLVVGRGQWGSEPQAPVLVAAPPLQLWRLMRDCQQRGSRISLAALTPWRAPAWIDPWM